MAGALRAPGGGQPPRALTRRWPGSGLAVLLLAGVWLAGCVDPYTGKSYYAGLDESTGVETTGKPIGYEVRPGDTLYRIAEKFSVSAKQIVAANNLQPPYHLEAGQRLAVPRPVAHVVIPEDTVYSIARRYKIEQSRLMAINGLDSPDSLQVGQRLALPWSDRDTQVASTGSGAPAGNSQRGGAGSPGGGAAPQGGAQASGGGRESPPGGVAAPVPTDRPAQQGAGEAGGASGGAGGTGQGADSGESGNPPDRRFLQPVGGDIIVGFGPQGEARHNDGINIAAEAGTPVRAAATGVVAYAGRDVEAFGKLVLLRHEGNWVTAYAHLGAIGVERGDELARGDRLGTVGATGKAQRPQLHFELRRGTEAIDPQPYLKAPKTPALAAR